MNKTYQETVTKPRLTIYHDEWSDSPREWSNLGYFITVDRDYHSPDKNETLERIVRETGDIAESQEQHMKLIKDDYKAQCDDDGDKIIAIYPVTKYEHGGVAYSLGTKHGFDNSNNGFYIVTEKSQAELGTEPEDFEKVIAEEIDIYNKYINGEVYAFTLYTEEGETEDSCGGFYSLDELRDSLPDEWKQENLEEFIID